jgi:hypothetical protein
MITKTINPIHFEDLDPHRFEDLVRQLVYDFKDWYSLEATGRSGSDEGFDARGWELLSEKEEEDDDENIIKSNIWLIQCKREKSINPSKMAKYLDDILSSDEQIYGIIFSAACDFSKKTRDVFLAKIRERGIQEYKLLGKGEIEGLLFQPKYDHLLFAYFGISLQIRKRSIKTKIRSRIATKKKIEKIFGLIKKGSNYFDDVILRNPEDVYYPNPSEIKDFDSNPHWRVYKMVGYEPDGILVMSRKYYAFYSKESKTYDTMGKFNISETIHNLWEVKNPENISIEDIEKEWKKIPEKNRYYFEIIRIVKFDKILAIDENGDNYFEGTHLFIEWDKKCGPFEPYCFLRINQGFTEQEYVNIESLKRIKKFNNKYRNPE